MEQGCEDLHPPLFFLHRATRERASTIARGFSQVFFESCVSSSYFFCYIYKIRLYTAIGANGRGDGVGPAQCCRYLSAHSLLTGPPRAWFLGIRKFGHNGRPLIDEGSLVTSSLIELRMCWARQMPGLDLSSYCPARFTCILYLFERGIQCRRVHSGETRNLFLFPC